MCTRAAKHTSSPKLPYKVPMKLCQDVRAGRLPRCLPNIFGKGLLQSSCATASGAGPRSQVRGCFLYCGWNVSAVNKFVAFLNLWAVAP